ncbi:hypothetical protein ACFPZL_02420 [Leucobacter soli]|nr:hypothetical protein [Leucobacter soli]
MNGATSSARILRATAVVASAGLALSAALIPAAPAEAAQATVRIVWVSQADALGRVAVKVKCQPTGKHKKKTCTGTVRAKVGSLTSAKTKFAIKAKKAKTVRVKLSAKQLQAIHDAKGNQRKASFVVVGSAPKKSTVKKTRTVKIAAPLRVVLMDTQASQGGVGVSMTCVSSKTCKGSASITVGGKTSAKTSFSILPKQLKTYRLTLSAAQLAALNGAKGSALGARITAAVTAPLRLQVIGSGSLEIPADPTDPGDPVDPVDPGGGHDHGDGDDESPYSHAYREGASWTPSEYDTCTAAEHNEYAVIGPDGKLYPGWHPPVHERADGTTCAFGHEHGDDPRNSDIYAWAMEQYAAEAAAAPNNREIVTVDKAAGEYLDVATDRALGLPFGYGSERLTEYSNANPTGPNVHRHEDDPGHKVIVSNNQKLRDGSNTAIKFPNTFGAPTELACDYLMKMHQGSHSNDPTKNNTHELFYAVQCNDGTKIFATTMTNYGNANELHSSCTRPFSGGQSAPTAVPTIGSDLPRGDGGMRLIPTADCISKYTTNGTGVYRTSDAGAGTTDDRRGSPASQTNGWWWAGYERWQSFTSITDESGKEIVRYEPWFGLQNPVRYYVSNSGKKADGTADTAVARLNDLAWEEGYQLGWQPWASQRAASETKVDWKSPDAWFNGAIRDAWITAAKVDHQSGSSNALYITPWGKGARVEPFEGSLRIYVSRTTNTGYVLSTVPSLTSRHTRTGEALNRDASASAPKSMNFFYDYGKDKAGNPLGVHAPN